MHLTCRNPTKLLKTIASVRPTDSALQLHHRNSDVPMPVVVEGAILFTCTCAMDSDC